LKENIKKEKEMEQEKNIISIIKKFILKENIKMELNGMEKFMILMENLIL
jgi:hypothetical protein